MRRRRLPPDDRARREPGRDPRPPALAAAAGRGRLRFDAECAHSRTRRREVRQPLAREGVPRRGVPGPVRGELRPRRAARPLPRAQAAPPRARDRPRVGRPPSPARHHRALLRVVHARDQRARLHPQARAARPRARLPGHPAMKAAPRPQDRGELAIVLHTHMPYVEGFDTWPFGEEWLWEALAGVYLPMLRALREAPVTLGVTPVLCDQLESLRGDAGERFLTFLRSVRAEIHAEDASGLDDAAAPEL